MTRREVSLARLRAVLGYAIATAAVAAVTAIVLAADSTIVHPNVSVFYLALILSAAFWLGTGPAALVLALVALDYYFSLPFGDMRAIHADDWARLLFLGVAAAIGILLIHMIRRRQQEAFLLAEANTRLLRETAMLAAEAQRHVGELNALLESLVEGVTIIDAEGRIILFNDMGKQLWHAPQAETAWTYDWYSHRDLRYPDGSPLPFEQTPIRRALRGERFAGFEVLYVEPAGRLHYLSFSGSAAHDEAGKIVLAINVYRDITQLRGLERLRDEFLAQAAQELKTPIAVLKGYAQALQGIPDAIAPRYRHILQSIDRQTSRIDALVRDLLDVSRLRAGTLTLQREIVDISALTREAASQAAMRTVRHEIEVRTPGQLHVSGDRERLQQVLERLLDNAIRYSPEGGAIDISVRRYDDRVQVAVQDRGIGIPAANQARIFERFYRAHAGTPHDYGGMGIGLYIAREIVQGLGGDMGFESKEGEGSSFWFTLPLVEDASKES